MQQQYYGNAPYQSNNNGSNFYQNGNKYKGKRCNNQNCGGQLPPPQPYGQPQHQQQQQYTPQQQPFMEQQQYMPPKQDFRYNNNKPRKQYNPPVYFTQASNVPIFQPGNQVQYQQGFDTNQHTQWVTNQREWSSDVTEESNQSHHRKAEN
ncbi:ATP-dependent RNA helicase DHH1-like [Schistocerca piceifrons]|uniref:ATP-dependent RNA helicase DHH1-like n=1 Tax=Schistocerca piceifrons TaxID=274613 RepID=UPI001F5E8C26|nr:ATP-dependent RNA helicase DHH1-like [Schistocerca piceifrons]